MHARVSIVQGSPDQVDAGLRNVREQVHPTARELEGFQGVITLIDRASGKGINITLWGTEQAMQASEEAADRLRAQAGEAFGQTAAPTVERYEVAVLDVPAGVTV